MLMLGLLKRTLFWSSYLPLTMAKLLIFVIRHTCVLLGEEAVPITVLLKESLDLRWGCHVSDANLHLIDAIELVTGNDMSSQLLELRL